MNYRTRLKRVLIKIKRFFNFISIDFARFLVIEIVVENNCIDKMKKKKG